MIFMGAILVPSSPGDTMSSSHMNRFATTARTLIRQTAMAGALLGLSISGGMTAAQAQVGRGLSLQDTRASELWPHWEGRLGMVLGGGSSHTLSNPYALSQIESSGLKVQSMHALSDYYFAGGFRATAGLVRGATNLPWWNMPSPEDGTTSLNLSLQRVDLVGSTGASGPGVLTDDPNRTVAYVGAGYSGRLTQATAGYGGWRFNADLGLISLNTQNIGRINRVLQGDQGVDELLRDLRLRPVLKFNVNYAF
jgi:hypothetical protein